MRTTSGTFELSLSAGGVDDEMVTFEVQVEGTITEADLGEAPSLTCPGDPGCEGYAEITGIEVCDRETYDKKPIVWQRASWLLNVIPQSVLDAWAVTIYESASHITDDRADWERDQRRDQVATKQRFAMLTGRAGT